ncbi:hypothetical protein Pla108_04550 [Botrimarina colliarenosi]|uniref:Uncharacterized protein n=1 Tax=Botrimarina colliarenosi TaxID=2528001 RepID=A0A5C6AK26_9BACT|nr:hypothetical protein Pla108_04550 [Botrimarina colliarenosi]
MVAIVAAGRRRPTASNASLLRLLPRARHPRSLTERGARQGQLTHRTVSKDAPTAESPQLRCHSCSSQIVKDRQRKRWPGHSLPGSTPRRRTATGRTKEPVQIWRLASRPATDYFVRSVCCELRTLTEAPDAVKGHSRVFFGVIQSPGLSPELRPPTVGVRRSAALPLQIIAAGLSAVGGACLSQATTRPTNFGRILLAP